MVMWEKPPEGYNGIHDGRGFGSCKADGTRGTAAVDP